MFMKRNLMKITIMTSETGHVSLVFECTRVAIFNWTEVVQPYSYVLVLLLRVFVPIENTLK